MPTDEAPLTRRQRDVLDAVLSLAAGSTIPPSLPEIAAAANLPTVASARRLVSILCGRGLLTRRPGVPRSVRPTDAAARS